ncbi:MAG: rRNA maturation RNase YbeY [Steroidobacteraceae bacterium]
MSGAPLRVDVSSSGRGRRPSAAQIGAWASAALGRRARGYALAVHIVGLRASRRLNGRFRGRDTPTNVLSFPASPTAWPAGAPAAGQDGNRHGRSGLSSSAPPLGDLVMCSPVIAAEARRQGKTVRAHWAHLIVHGTLHLSGYDHERPTDARRMERREIAVLKRLGFANPYRSV